MMPKTKCPSCGNTRLWKVGYMDYFEEEYSSNGYEINCNRVCDPKVMILVCGKCNKRIIDKLRR